MSVCVCVCVFVCVLGLISISIAMIEEKMEKKFGFEERKRVCVRV